ncbi:MAG: NAD(+) diphosphatase [Firmicutes bacterium]|nr:NAD(+) diphosphatase [Bacillota bacterium]
MHFIPAPPLTQSTGSPSYWLVFYRDLLLVSTVDRVTLPLAGDGGWFLELNPLRRLYLGTLDGCPCLAVEVGQDAPLPPGMSWMDLRRLFFAAENLFAVAGRAIQVLNWDRNHQYCGHCGGKTSPREGETVRVCPDCGLEAYPRISPAVIAAIVRGDEILLAYNRTFKTRFYSVLAGFVEPGESLEDCLRREVREEVGIEIKNIRYFGSQPWPFPNSLMIGFTAEYDRGKLKLDDGEIIEAGWFKADRLPDQIPGRLSIARRLIDWFVESRRPPDRP